MHSASKDCLVFVFAESYERSHAFLSKTFSQQPPQISLNPPTDAVILKVLTHIRDQEGVNVADDTLRQIRDAANKDLTSAITMLQFQSSGKHSLE